MKVAAFWQPFVRGYAPLFGLPKQTTTNLSAVIATCYCNLGKYIFKVDTINLKNKKDFKPGRINVFVGANNCGKTQLLEEIFAFITGEGGRQIFTRKIVIPFPKTWKVLKEGCNIDVSPLFGGIGIRCVSPTFSSMPVVSQFGRDMDSVLNDYLQNRKDDVQLRKWIGPSLVTYLKTDNRLRLTKSQQSQGLAEGPQNLLEMLYTSNTNNFEKVKEYTKTIFQKDILLSPYNPGKLEFKIHDSFAKMPSNPQLAYEKLKSIPNLDKQGDGMRSVVGIIAALVCSGNKSIILLDEPEAFLHPPQALQLGTIIGKLIQSNQQIFIATHNADFLRGLLSSGPDLTQYMKIVHIGRNPKDTISFNVLDTDELNKIITDPLLSSSRVLDGLFYKGVVATEGDADAVFYQRAFQKVGLSDEIHFVNAHNKQTLKKIIEPYQKLNVKFAMIADADVIRDLHEFREILQVTDKKDIVDRILELRAQIIAHYEKQSKYDLLVELREKTRLLVEEDLISDQASPQEIHSALFEFRKKLKKIRDEANELATFKKEGRKDLPSSLQICFDEMWELCATVGLFIVSVGELESWLIDYEINRTDNKSRWITQALTKLCEIEYEEDKDLWRFINKLKEYLSK